ncbi:30S ribosomal protein S6 [bacterium]|nr:30S ribosomal protein S6 [bacterium]
MPVRPYELLVVLDPVRTEEQQKESIEKINEVIAKYGATTTKVDVWGKRRLAYIINKRREGYYVCFQIEADSVGKALSEIDRHCKFSDDVFRHMVTSAVVGKSAGNPALDREREERMARQDTRPGRGPRPRRDFTPVEQPAPSSEAEPAPAAPAE